MEDSASLPAGPATMALAGIWFSLSAAIVALLAIAVPHTPRMDEAGLAAAAGASALLALCALIAFDRLHRAAFQLGCALASVIAVAGVYFWGEDAVYGPLPLLWPTVYAFAFFGVRPAVGQLAFAGALWAGVLVIRDSGYLPVASFVATIATLGLVGMFVAIARERLAALVTELSDAARRDPLTGLLNRRGFEELFDVELERSRRGEQGLSIVVGDLDGFKAINDRFGHSAGDEALRRVGAALMHDKRSWDAAARVGGEEFAILAPDTDEHGAYILAERLRAAVQSAFEQSGLALTISFGIVSHPVHGQTPEALLQAGDQALYAAKQLGRNRSVISSAEVPGILARGSRAARGSGSRSDEGHVELATLLRFAEALDVRDSGSTTHCQRVGRYAELIARELGLAPAAVERVRIAGILHDVGRVGVPDSLLVKEGPLSEEDWAWVRAHPATGARMLETTEFADIGAWILAHHERPDGAGYPDGREAGEVPIEAAILAAADAYEAMTAPRAYRAPLDPQAASEELRRGAGRQFDERVVDALLRVI